MKSYIAAVALVFVLGVPSVVFAQVIPQQGGNNSNASSNSTSAPPPNVFSDTHGGSSNGNGNGNGGGNDTIIGGGNGNNGNGNGNGKSSSASFDYRLSCPYLTQNPTVDSCRQDTTRPSSYPY